MEEEVVLYRFPTYTVLNLLALAFAAFALGYAVQIVGMILSYIAALCALAVLPFALAAYYLAPKAVAESGGFRSELLTLLLPAVNILMFVALLVRLGAFFYWNIMVMAVAFMLLYKPPKMPKPDIKWGVMGGVAMFITVMLVISILTIAGVQGATTEAVLLAWSIPEMGQGAAAQLEAILEFLVIALGEELWARLTLGYGGSAVAGPRTAWFWSTYWFLFMHTPSRLQYGMLAPVILAILGTVMVVFLLFFRKNPSVWTGVVMHATYNTLLAGVYYGTLLLELAVLAVLLYALSKITEVRIEIKLPKLEEVVLHG